MAQELREKPPPDALPPGIPNISKRPNVKGSFEGNPIFERGKRMTKKEESERQREEKHEWDQGRKRSDREHPPSKPEQFEGHDIQSEARRDLRAEEEDYMEEYRRGENEEREERGKERGGNYEHPEEIAQLEEKVRQLEQDARQNQGDDFRYLPPARLREQEHRVSEMSQQTKKAARGQARPSPRSHPTAEVRKQEQKVRELERKAQEKEQREQQKHQTQKQKDKHHNSSKAPHQL